jgi:hypothetical protein
VLRRCEAGQCEWQVGGELEQVAPGAHSLRAALVGSESEEARVPFAVGGGHTLEYELVARVGGADGDDLLDVAVLEDGGVVAELDRLATVDKPYMRFGRDALQQQGMQLLADARITIFFRLVGMHCPNHCHNHLTRWGCIAPTIVITIFFRQVGMHCPWGACR